MDDDEKEIRRILQSAQDTGGYNQGHIVWIRNLANKKVARLQEDLKVLLNIQDCGHDF